MLPISGSREHGCSSLPLAPRSAIRISSPSRDPQADPKTSGGEGGNAVGGPLLAMEDMVCRPERSVNRTTMEDPIVCNLAVSRPSPTSGATVAQLSHMEIEWQRLRREQFSSQVINTIQAARRPSTNRIYQATWSTFCLQKVTFLLW
uniref:Uncharacterized protein n=1 Tax=Micrurus lemniscatus lemniscatus TaxID=129467 RepID=A0A2D4J9W0_MICLE